MVEVWHKKSPLIWHSPPNLGLMCEDTAKIGRFSNHHQYISKIINIEKQRDKTAQNQVIQSNSNMHTSQCRYNQFSGPGNDKCQIFIRTTKPFKRPVSSLSFWTGKCGHYCIIITCHVLNFLLPSKCSAIMVTSSNEH